MIKQVVEFPEYTVDDSGCVYYREKKLNEYIQNGYRRVSFSRDGKQYMRKTHRVVAQAFVENLNGDEQVDHIDEDKLNNSASNLRWCSHEENCGYYSNKATNQTPRQIVIDGKVFESVSMASKFISEAEGKNRSSINREMRRFLDGRKRTWTAYKKYKITKP